MLQTVKLSMMPKRINTCFSFVYWCVVAYSMRAGPSVYLHVGWLLTVASCTPLNILFVGDDPAQWSMGCVLYELMTLRKAFDGSSLPALVLNIVRGEYPEPPRELFSPELRALLKSMLARDPVFRPTAEEVLSSSAVRPQVKEYATALRTSLNRRPELLVSVPSLVDYSCAAENTHGDSGRREGGNSWGVGGFTSIPSVNPPAAAKQEQEWEWDSKPAVSAMQTARQQRERHERGGRRLLPSLNSGGSGSGGDSGTVITGADAVTMAEIATAREVSHEGGFKEAETGEQSVAAVSASGGEYYTPASEDAVERAREARRERQARRVAERKSAAAALAAREAAREAERAKRRASQLENREREEERQRRRAESRRAAVEARAAEAEAEALRVKVSVPHPVKIV